MGLWPDKSCPNYDPRYEEWICTCRKDVPDEKLRDVLNHFINGWIGEHGHAEARRLAANPEATPDRMRALLSALEKDANDAYGMWRQTL